MYKLQMTAGADLVISGIPVEVSSTPISLIAGWNWIGYLPQNSGALGEALASVGELATFISSQASGTAQNYSEYGWYGAYHSAYWVDPAEELIVVYLTQLIPAALNDQNVVRALVYQSIID